MSGTANKPFTVDLLTFLFLVAAALYVLLTFVLRPPDFPLSPWEFVYVHGAEGLLPWPYYILWHPYFAILWAAFIAAAAVQFCRRREWGRAALHLSTWLALLVVIMSTFFLLPLFLLPIAMVSGWFGLAAVFTLAAALWALCILIIGALGSPKVKAAMIDRPMPGKPRSR